MCVLSGSSPKRRTFLWRFSWDNWLPKTGWHGGCVCKKKASWPILTLAVLSLVPWATADLQNAGLHPTSTALPQVAACTPKHSHESNLRICPTGTGVPTSVAGGWVFLSLSFFLNYVKDLRHQPQTSDCQPTWRKVCYFGDYLCCGKIHSTKSVFLWGLARDKLAEVHINARNVSIPSVLPIQ